MQSCPCCNIALAVGAGKKKSGVPFRSLTCGNNPRHCRVFVTMSKYKVIDLQAWSFVDASELFCPVCNEPIKFAITRSERGLFGTCEDNPDHLSIFLNRPLKLQWDYFLSYPGFQEWAAELQK